MKSWIPLLIGLPLLIQTHSELWSNLLFTFVESKLNIVECQQNEGSSWIMIVLLLSIYLCYVRNKCDKLLFHSKHYISNTILDFSLHVSCVFFSAAWLIFLSFTFHNNLRSSKWFHTVEMIQKHEILGYCSRVDKTDSNRKLLLSCRKMILQFQQAYGRMQLDNNEHNYEKF